jgi:hypothetical protein
MKLFSLLLSIIVFFVTCFFLVNDFEYSFEVNHIIYMTLLVVLLFIAVVGILINFNYLLEQREKINNIFSENNFNRKN